MIIENLRKYKVMKMALFDLVMTFIAVLIIHSLMWAYPLDMKEKNNRTWLQYISSLMLLFVSFIGLGVIFHRLFGIKSALSAYLGFND